MRLPSLGAACAVLLPAAAAAHLAGLSRSTWHLSGAEVSVELELPARELPDLGTPPSGAAVIGATVARIRVTEGGEPCHLSGSAVVQAPSDAVAVRGTWTCPAPGNRAEVDLGPFLSSLPAGHTHVATVEGGAGARQQVLRANAATLRLLSPGAPAAAGALAFLRLGVEHILFGLDHLAFLLAVLILAPSLVEVAKIITSFTVAHSLTLAAAATGLVTVSPSLVEPLIAASIFAVGAENLWLTRPGADPAARARALRRRWRITFAFGLVHGLGFAAALRGVELRGGAFVMALLSFNAGVELGQLAVAAIFLASWWVVRGTRGALHAPRLGSALVAVAGLVWLVVRVGAR